MGFSEILLDKKDDFKKYGDILGIINVCAKKLAKDVNNMIDIAEIENDIFILNKETFDLIKLVNEVIVAFKKNGFSIKNKDINISSIYGSLIIYADKNRMKFTIENLITNAIDIPDTNNIEIMVEKTKSASYQNDYTNQGFVLISIIDDGTGIDRLLLPSLFSKFVADSQDGLGLGLYLAKIIVERDGGEIWTENNENGKGVTFKFSIPT